MIDDCNINNLAKNYVSAVFHSRDFGRSVTQTYRDFSRDRYVCALRWGANMAAVTLQKHLSLSFPIEAKIFTLKLRQIEINASSSASAV